MKEDKTILKRSGNHRQLYDWWWVKIERDRLLPRIQRSQDRWKHAGVERSKDTLKEYSRQLYELIAFQQKGLLRSPKKKQWQKDELEVNIRLFNEFRDREFQGESWAALDFTGNDFSGFYLRSANLAGTTFDHARFMEADCQDAILSGSSGIETDFYRTDCQFATFEESNFQDACFREAILDYVTFHKASLPGTNFIRARCKGVNFMHAQCTNAYFIEANIEGSNFYSAHCQNADFSRVTGKSSNFRGSFCDHTNFSGASLSGSNFTHADLRNAKMTAGTNLLACRFYNAKLARSEIKYAHHSFFDEDDKLRSFPEEIDALQERKGDERREKLRIARSTYRDFGQYFRSTMRDKEADAFEQREQDLW